MLAFARVEVRVAGERERRAVRPDVERLGDRAAVEPDLAEIEARSASRRAAVEMPVQVVATWSVVIAIVSVLRRVDRRP